LGDEESWPAGQRTGSALVDAVADEELRGNLEQRLADPSVRAEFDQEVRRFDEQEWRQMHAGLDQQPTLEQLAGEGSTALVLSDEEDLYTAAARDVLANDSSIAAVVMGHTHGAIDGLAKPLYLDGGRTGYYFNSGTWTPHLRDRPNYRYSWREIGDPTNYTSSLTYLRLVPDARGEYQVEFHSWAAEMS
jgi:hypothetical protein